MIILVCGDRNWGDFLRIYITLQQYQHTATLVVHGAARGADTLAGEAADALHIPVKSFPANWDLYGKSAGPIRNRAMFNETSPNLVLAFHNNLSSSKGTKDMVEYAIKHGVSTKVISETGKIVHMNPPTLAPFIPI